MHIQTFRSTHTEEHRERARILRQAERDADISGIDVDDPNYDEEAGRRMVEEALERNPEGRAAIERAREHARRFREKQAREQSE